MTVTIKRSVFVWLLVMSFLSPMAVGIASIAYSGYNQRQSDQRWCQLFAGLDRPVDPRIVDPVQRERTRRTVEQIHKLRVDLGCIER